MGNMFSKPKVEAMPKQPDPTPLPIRDDEEERRAKMKTWAAAAKRTGDASTRMAGMGGSDDNAAQTRTGSAVLGAG